MTNPEPETSGQDAVSDDAVEAAVADLRRVATECVCGTDDDAVCTCPSIFEHVTSGHEVVEIHGLVEDVARWALTAGAPHLHAQWAGESRARAEVTMGPNRIVEVDEDDEVDPSWAEIEEERASMREDLAEARADERARVLGEVQEALRDSKRLRAWETAHQPHGEGRMCPTCAAAYLADVLGTADGPLARVLAALDDHAGYHAWHAEHRDRVEAAASVLDGVRAYLVDTLGRTGQAATDIPCQVYRPGAHGQRICDRKLADAPPCCFPQRVEGESRG